jgi:hypothetical protein
LIPPPVVGSGNLLAVRSQIITGLGDTNGITSDMTTPGVHGLGYAAGNDPNLNPILSGSLSGQLFDGDSVLVKFTCRGDADLDGDSDLDDLGFWSSTFTGDLGGGGLSVYAPNAPAGALAALSQLGITAVPEPGVVSLLMPGFAVIASRALRRRNRDK